MVLQPRSSFKTNYWTVDSIDPGFVLELHDTKDRSSLLHGLHVGGQRPMLFIEQHDALVLFTDESISINRFSFYTPATKLGGYTGITLSICPWKNLVQTIPPKLRGRFQQNFIRMIGASHIYFGTLSQNPCSYNSILNYPANFNETLHA